MGEVERIAEQLRRTYAGNAWHGPGIRELLEGVTPAMATVRLLPNTHTIWELALHITAWTEAVLRRLDGDPANLGPEESWPPVGEASEQAWLGALDRLEKAQRALEQRIPKLEDKDLDEPIIAGMSSVYVTLHGLIQHDLYHAGQIAILKKGAE